MKADRCGVEAERWSQVTEKNEWVKDEWRVNETSIPSRARVPCCPVPWEQVRWGGPATDVPRGEPERNVRWLSPCCLRASSVGWTWQQGGAWAPQL